MEYGKTQHEELVAIATKQLVASSEFKKPRLEKIKEYEDTYLGKQKPKIRIQFSVPLPVLSGMVDKLISDFDEELDLKFSGKPPVEKQAIERIQAITDKQLNSLRPNARWDYKVRCDKFLAVMTGRGIQKTFAESDPEFALNFDVVDLKYFHFEPKGGGLLERHLFCGEEGIFKTREQLENGAISGLYLAENVKQILAGHTSGRKNENFLRFEDKLNRFQAMGLDAESNSYVGQEVYNLVEWYMTYKGKRWYLLFDPFTQIAVRCEPLKQVFESGLYPYTSWATHEDPKNFLSKSYTDDCYPVHDYIYTALNQDLTWRSNKLMGSRAFDKDMFNPVDLDAMYQRPGKLVPADTKGGTRQIASGVYEFNQGDLSGTIDLISWMKNEFMTSSGIQDINTQANQQSANVVYSFLQSANKRIGHKAKSFQEAYAEVGLRIQHGLVEHLNEVEAIKQIGIDGYGWKLDLPTIKNVDCEIVSIAEQEKENILGKDAKKKAIESITANPSLIGEVNPKKITEIILRDIGGWDKQSVDEIMDKNAFMSADMTSKADIAILELARGKMPEVVFDATTGFAERIIKFEKDHRNQLKEKSSLFYDYVDMHTMLIAENMARLAGQMTMQPSGMPPQNSPTPNNNSQSLGQMGVPQVQMSDMAIGGLQ